MSPGRTILLVDDDRDFVASVATYLEAQGYRVYKAFDGREGLRLAQQCHPDLILVDIMMDERTEGFFTIQNIRRLAGLDTVPIIVLSALYAAEGDGSIPLPDARWVSHDVFLAKPVELPALLARIRLTLGDREGAASAGDTP